MEQLDVGEEESTSEGTGVFVSKLRGIFFHPACISMSFLSKMATQGKMQCLKR